MISQHISSAPDSVAPWTTCPAHDRAPQAAGRKSIVLVVNWLDVGGAEVQVVRLALGLHERGWKVSVVSLLPAGSLSIGLLERGIDVHSLNMRPGMPNPMGMIRLRRLIRSIRPDIVHSHIVHANVLARMTRLLTRMRVLVCTAHNIQEGGWTHNRLYRHTDWLADLTTNVSQAAVDRYIQTKAAPARRIRFVPNGLDTNYFRKNTDARQRLRTELDLHGRFVWLAVGRFHVQKDYPNMLRAFAAASGGEGPPVLLLAGAGELEANIRELAASLGVAGRVRFLGVRPDVDALMNAADAFVLSSAWEGMPLVLQEASASELPIVATQVGGNAEVVLDEVSGLLVRAGDDAALARAMEKMMGLAAPARQTMGKAGRDYVVNRYGMEGVLDQWEDIYEELLRDKGKQ